MFLGDFFYDARCINMANTIIDAGMELNIIDAGPPKLNHENFDKLSLNNNLPDTLFFILSLLIVKIL